MISLTRQFRFEAAHALTLHPGLCKNIHGHSYLLEVTVTGYMNPDTQMIIDFKQLKQIVNENLIDKLDHALILAQSTALADTLEGYTGKVFRMEEEPTAENMLTYFASLLTRKLPENVKLKRLRLHETSNCYADWEP